MANSPLSLPASAVPAVILLLSITSLPAAAHSSSRDTRRTSTCNNNNNYYTLYEYRVANTKHSCCKNRSLVREQSAGRTRRRRERGGKFTSERKDRAASGWTGARASGRSPVRGTGGARSLRRVTAPPKLSTETTEE